MDAPDTTETPPTAVATATFAAPASAVWAYRLDFTNLPGYNPDVSDVERIHDGDSSGVGGVCGAGARYAFQLADPVRAGATHPVELWTTAAVEPTLVAAGMNGGTEAYEEFVVSPLEGGGCTATLTLWVMLPKGLDEKVREAAAASSLEQISKEMRLMKEFLESTQ